MALNPKGPSQILGSLVRLFAIGLFASLFLQPSARAIQFDVFLGYDGIVPEASWFPLVCEIKNDGPPFTGVVEVAPLNYNQGQTRRLVLELPTGTLKRITLPLFSATRGYSTWDVRLLDERGKVRAEQLAVRARKHLASDAPLLGCLPRTAGGAPSIQPVLSQQSELQPASARFQSPIFPDNPLVLEGMRAFYLNSEKAPELRATQVSALQGWLYAGGHLIVAVEQITDVNSTPWLKNLLPCDLSDIRTIQGHPELQEWIKNSEGWRAISQNPRIRKNGKREPVQSAEAVGSPFADLSDDLKFETAELQVAIGKIREGETVISSGGVPLVLSAPKGRGHVTVILFSPEREPVRSWKNLPAFWAKLAEVPANWYVSSDSSQPGGWSTDSVFGAMIETKQVHKLPIEWLLLLLVAYLVVIGPLDHYWLKRIGRPMLTWITFPCYVVFFSLLIYFIGYKLRAGESEWNELHVVDVLASGSKAELRGRTYVSVYSPSNQRYNLDSQQRFATFRSEFSGWGAPQSGERATVLQNGDSFKAEIFVPVWSSQLFVSDWWQSAAAPLEAHIQSKGDGWEMAVENKTNRKVTNVQVAMGSQIFALGDFPPHALRTNVIVTGMTLTDFASVHGREFQSAVQSHMYAFGSSEKGRINDVPNASIALGLTSLLRPSGNYALNFIAPPGVDVGADLVRGGAVLFAWDPDYSPVPPLQRFKPKRSHRDTLWRIPVPL